MCVAMASLNTSRQQKKRDRLRFWHSSWVNQVTLAALS